MNKLLSAFLLLVSFSSSASMITSESLNFDYHQYVNSSGTTTDSTVQNLYINGFDSSLGNLLNVTIELDSTLTLYKKVSGYTSNVCLFGCSVSANAKGEHSADFRIFETGSGYFYLNDNDRTLNISCTGSRGSCSQSNTQTYDYDLSLNGLALNDTSYFEQARFLITLINSVKFTQCKGNECYYNANARWQGNITVSYEYEPATTVSAPTTMPTLLISMLLLFVSKRKRHA